MRFDEESDILALRQTYCYLRLAGMSSEAAMERVRRALETQAAPASEGADRLLPTVLHDEALRLPEPPPSPPLERGHVHCP